MQGKLLYDHYSVKVTPRVTHHKHRKNTSFRVHMEVFLHWNMNTVCVDITSAENLPFGMFLTHTAYATRPHFVIILATSGLYEASTYHMIIQHVTVGVEQTFPRASRALDSVID